MVEDVDDLVEGERGRGSEAGPHPSPLPAYRERGEEGYRERGQGGHQGRRRVWVMAGVLAILAGGVFWYATVWGIGLSPDSGFYIKAARHMLGREQVEAAQTREMSSHFPPGYAGVLAGMSVGGADPQAVARGLNMVLFAVNALLVALLVWRASGGSAWAAGLSGLFVIFAPSSLGTHTVALSEPLFMALVLGSFYLLSRYLESGRVRWMIFAGIAAGLAVITRYAGVSLALAGGIAIVMQSGPWKRRVRHAAAFVALCLAPVLIVGLVNKMMWGTTVNRAWAFHPMSARHLRDGLMTMAEWFLPVHLSRVKLVLAGGLVLVAAIVAIAISLGQKDGLSRTASLFVLAYGAVLMVSISFVDFHTPVDERLLLPVLLAGLVVAAGAGKTIATLNREMGIAILAGAGIVVAATILRGGFEAATMHREGIGYASAAWQRSELVRAVKEVPADKIVYSNAADVVYLVARRQAAPVPAKVNATSTLANPEYEKQLVVMGAEIHAGRAVLAYFRKFEDKRPYYPRGAELAERLSLKVLVQGNDGALYEPGERH